MNMHFTILSVTHGTTAAQVSASRGSASTFPGWLGWVLPVAAPVSLAVLLFCALRWERWLLAGPEALVRDDEDRAERRDDGIEGPTPPSVDQPPVVYYRQEHVAIRRPDLSRQ